MKLLTRFLFCLCCLSAPLSAQQSPPPETSPLPPERPDPEDRLDVMELGKPEDVPRPPPQREALAEEPETLAACLAGLEALGTTFERIDPITTPDEADCGIANPIRITEVLPGLAITPAAEVRCETATALARWAAEIVQPAARAMGERGDVVSLEQGSGYICRRRNNAPEGKLSEHAFGNAVDIMAFRFAQGDPIRVEPREREGTLAEAFQRTVRAGSCLYFTTVLGPGIDAAHADHLHLDIKQRRGGFRLCQ